MGILSWLFGHEEGKDQSNPKPSEVQMVDPSTLLFSLPTICDRMAPLKEEPVRPPEGALSFHEDDWRQIEFVAAQDKAYIEKEIKALEKFKDDNRAGMGYRSIYTRKDHPTHLSSLQIKLASVEESLGISGENRKRFFIFSSFGAEQHHEVMGGFAYLVSDGLWLYGMEENGVIGGLGLHFGGQAEIDQDTFGKLMGMAHQRGLILVNWLGPELRDPSENVSSQAIYGNGGMPQTEAEPIQGTKAVSEHWEVYPCEIDQHRAVICYDHGLREAIGTIPQRYFLRISIDIKEPTVDGHPQGQEHDTLKKLEDAIVPLIEKSGGIYAGRLTGNGKRFLHLYTGLDEPAVESIVSAAAKTTGHAVEFELKDDPERKGYWDLFPTDQDWQVIQDMKVIRSLQEHGDDCQKPRRIDHWLYFKDGNDLALFKKWSIASGYTVESSKQPDEDNKQWSLQIYHTATPLLGEINRHTLSLSARAKEFNGEYDGWETSVEK